MIQLTQEIDRLREMAEGSRPFAASRLYEKLTEKVGTAEYRKLDPQTRLALGYYLCARQRHEMLNEGEVNRS